MKPNQVTFPVKNIHISKDWKELEEYLKRDKIVVAPTDTLYGILANALNKNLVEKVYKIKKRKPEKPYIILIPDVKFLSIFGIKPSEKERKLLENKGITVVIDLPVDVQKEFEYLHRGQKSLAFRIPAKKELLKVLKNIKKPVIAPSANPEGLPPAESIEKAVEYFENQIDLYLDEGSLKNIKPSTIVKLKDKKPVILREGNISISQINHILQIK